MTDPVDQALDLIARCPADAAVADALGIARVDTTVEVVSRALHATTLEAWELIAELPELDAYDRETFVADLLERIQRHQVAAAAVEDYLLRARLCPGAATPHPTGGPA